MNSRLTIKQEHFCQEYTLSSNASKAYRAAYNAKNMKPSTIWVKASNMLKKDKIRVRILEIIRKYSSKYDISREMLTEEMLYTIYLSKLNSNATLLRKSIVDLAKLHGFL